MNRTVIFYAVLAVVALITGCKSVKEPGLTLSEWKVKTFVYEGDTVALPKQAATLQFTDTNTIFGAAGCNRYFGSYVSGRDTIAIKPVGRTMMFCPDMGFEDKFIFALEAASTFAIKDSILTVTDRDKLFTLTFIPVRDEKLIGTAPDSHDCNAAAGYTWSLIKEDCIRIFEEGVRMNSLTDKKATSSAFILFSADSAQVELFFPENEVHPILDRRSLPSGGYAWNVEDDDTYNVRQKDGRWIIERRGVELYESGR